MTVSIFVVTHKAVPPISNEIYKPIQVGPGADIFPGIMRDRTSDTIWTKNSSFCELTAAYWIRKNFSDADIIGLCHYRRWFNFFPSLLSRKPSRQKKVTLADFMNTSVAKTPASATAQKVIDLLKHHDVLLLRPYRVQEGLSASYYNEEGHRKSDWDQTLDIINEMYPDYALSIQKYLNSPGNFHIGNMMVAPKQIWDTYFDWLFPILIELETRIKIPEDPVQGRVFGYVSERLLNLYVYHNKLRIKNLGGYKITDI